MNNDFCNLYAQISIYIIHVYQKTQEQPVILTNN